MLLNVRVMADSRMVPKPAARNDICYSLAIPASPGQIALPTALTLCCARGTHYWECSLHYHLTPLINAEPKK